MSLTLIRSVDRESPAHKAGIYPGEILSRVNGHLVADVLDYKYYTYDSRLELTLTRPDGGARTVRIRKREGEDLGLNFETYLMDCARSCTNRCIFCFVDQMPPGMRKTLYFKDDDARLSFLMGNYITLTNLSERELQRIIDLRISPINISVHATDPILREAMLKNRKAGQCLEQMKRLALAGITMNCQIVSCPGVNDGPALERTLCDLAELYPQVKSISVVPVGLTRYREGLCDLAGYTGEAAAAVLDLVEDFSRKSLKLRGTALAWCSDEFYLKADRELPEDSYYEDYTQLENGVGMLRLLAVEFGAALSMLEGTETAPAFAIATGAAAAPHIRALLKRLQARCPGIQGAVYPIANRFFGESINVSGLITGRDLIDQLEGLDLGKRLLIPLNMLRRGEQVFLDDITVSDVEAALKVPLIGVEQDGGALLDAMIGEASLGEALTPSPELQNGEYYCYNPSRER